MARSLLPSDILCVYLGHHKCASSWITTVLREVCFRLAWRFRVVHRPEDWQRQGYPSLEEYVRVERPRMLSYTNAEASNLEGLSPWRGVHVVRDPRDVWVSGYYSHLHSHPTEHWPELEAHRRQLQGLPTEEGLWLELEFSAWVFEQMATWDYHQPHVLEMKMEALSANPEEEFRRVLGHLGVLNTDVQGPVTRLMVAAVLRLNTLHWRGRHRFPFGMTISPLSFPLQAMPEAEVGPAVRRKSFERLSGGRKKGEENVESHFRKGKAGDWKNHLSAQHLASFESAHPGLVERLGYAPLSVWSQQSGI